MNRPLTSKLGIALGVALLAVAPVQAATVTLVNFDPPGVGFNDPTVVAPVGGNTGTTLGEQRLIAVQYAADLWGAELESDVEITVASLWTALNCNATGAVLASAGAISWWGNTSGVEYANVWYPSALANKLAGEDLFPGPDPDGDDLDLVVFFNINLGNPGCLTGIPYYYGLDANEGANKVDIVAVGLHEMGHGLGFANFINEATGASLGSPALDDDIYAQYSLDVSTGENWNQMTNGERVVSAINSRRVVWNGDNVTAETANVLAPGTPLLTVNSPAGIAGAYSFGINQFSAALSSPGVTADVAIATDVDEDGGGTVNTTTDACSAIDNPGAIAGKIALVDRGSCTAVVKVTNCEAVGAVGVIIADNVAGAPPPGFAGVLASAIPSGRITRADGITIKTALLTDPVNATLGLDLAVLAGTEATTGFVHLNAPNPLQPGSSISHWDPIAFPNLIMEPAINGDLPHVITPPSDLTIPQMTDIGWFSDDDGVPDGDGDECLGSDTSDTVVIDGCDTGAENDVLSTGCTITDEVNKCAAAATTHEGFTACVTQVTNRLVKTKVITNKEKSQIQKCAGLAAIP